MNRRLVEKMDKILQLNKPKKLLTMWSIDNICNKLKAELISNRLDITRHSELLATLYQNVALKIFDNLEETSINLMKKSYELWKTIYYSKELRTNDERIDILFKLTTTGIIAGYFAETRMILKELDFDKMYESEKLNNGTSNIKNSIFIVFFLLIRKLNGWYDINKVDTIINELNNKLEHVINTTKKRNYCIRSVFKCFRSFSNI
ncbi:hypothetical protein Z965_05170 [Clostridium novyi A str. BKT29909]|uniref:hypothetical protein n=1 Tax=Clostridium novyi TaxID=1542 RepID=UPI0004D63AB4|nr:hypothetical protein [Clostridium novyi]KEH87957.1 hypothetical protein Z965_05170 [Clostridium novyi A str. BKT29909]